MCAVYVARIYTRGTYILLLYSYNIYFIKKTYFFYSSRRIADAIHDCNIYRVYGGDGVGGGHGKYIMCTYLPYTTGSHDCRQPFCI